MSATIANTLIVVAALAIIIAAAAALWMVARMVTRGKPRVFRLELSNQGNVSGRYELKAEEASGQVRFQFLANGAPLTAAMTARADDAAQQGSARQAPAAPSGVAAGVQKSGGFVSSVAEIILSIGYMLPSNIGGQALLSAGQSMKEGTYAADRAVNVKSMVADLGQNSRSESVSAASGSTSARAAAPVDACAQTPVIDAGARLAVDLRVESLHPNQAGQYPFRVISRMLDVPEAPQSTENGTAAFAGVSLLQRAWPIIAFVVIAAGTVACSAFLIMSRALVGSQ